MHIRIAIWLLITMTWMVVPRVQAQESISFYHGLEPHAVKVLPHTRPPYVALNDILDALALMKPLPIDGNLRMTINGRALIFDQTNQQALFKGKSLPFPMREQNGLLYVRINKLAEVLTDLLGRRMIYEETSKTIHMPKSELIQVSVSGNTVPDGYRLVLSYSQSVRAPVVEKSNNALSIKIPDGPLAWDRTGFVSNDAITGMEVFQGLPDGSTEVLVQVGSGASRFDVLPFNPRNPRTVVKVWGTFGPQGETIAAAQTTPSERKDGLSRIVIDPGHGGKDHGAVGPTGLKEKDVTLKLARMLRDRLARDPRGYQVKMTRDVDTLLSLKERTGVANHFKADLFISIHVNAIRFQNARGSETYYLSLDEDAEFDTSHYEEFQETLGEAETGPSDMDDELTLMLWDMAQTKHLEDSFRIARYIQTELNDLAGIKSRGVKQAPLKVLKGATMPAILVEVAFISNRFEENKLKSPAFLEKVVESMALAIRSYELDVQTRGKQRNRATNEEGF